MIAREVYRKDRGVWVVQLRHPSLEGGRQQITAGPGPEGKKKAKRWAIELGARLVLEGSLRSPASPVPTVEKAAQLYLAHYTTRRNPRPGTLRLRQNYLEHHVVAFFAGRRIDEIATDAAVDELIRAKQAPGGAMRGKRLSDRVIKGGVLTALRALFDYAIRQGWIAGANPLRGGEPFTVADEPAQPDPFEHRELAALLQAAKEIDPRWALRLRCWAQSGMRSGELRALRRGDLDPATGDVRVERTRTRSLDGPPKRPRSRRLAALTHPVCEPAWDEWRWGMTTPESLAVLEALDRLVPLDFEAPLFPSLKDPSRPMEEAEQRWLWKRTVRRAGVRYRVAEQLRHTFVSTTLSRGAPPLAVANQTGHSIQVMLQCYAKWLPQGRPDATNRNHTATRIVSRSANHPTPHEEQRGGL